MENLVLFKVLSRRRPERTEESHGNPHDSRSLGRGLNPELHEYVAGMQ